MRLSSHTPHKKARIEIIPLIDIMFFLLASFMLVSLSMTRLEGMKMNLPGAARPAAQQIQKPDFVTVNIDGNGNVTLGKDKEVIRNEDLDVRVRKLIPNPSDPKVYINADAAVTHGRVVEVLAQLRNARIDKVTFAIKPNKGGPAPTGAPPATNP